MSAFSDWNGPGCGGGGDGFYIRFIREIEGKLIELKAAIDSATDSFNQHKVNTSTAHNVEGRLNSLSASLEMYANNLQYIVSTSADRTAIDSAIKRSSDDDQDYTRRYVDNTFTDIQAKYEAYTDKKVGDEITAREQEDGRLQNLIANIQKMIDTVNGVINVDLIKPYKTQLVEIASNLKTIDIYCKELFLKNRMDFTQFKKVNAIAYPDPDGGGNYVLIVGRLSTEYSYDMFNTSAVKPKPATAYIKFVNTMPWNAIVDMSGSVSNDGANNYRGAITAVVSKAPKNDGQVIIDRGPITFGLYRSSTISGDHFIYLGLKVEEPIGSFIQGGHAANMTFFIAGINFVPGTNSGMPSASVTKICSATAIQPGDFTVSHITSDGGINTDSIDNLNGNNLISTNRDGKMYIGSQHDFKELVFYSTDRPTIFHSDLSANKVAYLTDLSQSVYWQRAVTIIEDYLTTLNALRVTVDSNGKVIRWDPTGNNVPGYYLTDPTGYDPTGHVFTVSNIDNKPDTALIRFSGTTEQVVDGEFHGTIAVGTTYSINQITGVAPEVVKLGTTVIDSTGNTYKITDINTNNRQVVFGSTDSKDIFTYDCPAYAEFNGTEFVSTETIEIPKTFDGYIHDVSYEWSGVHQIKSDKTYYIESYVTWTPHHQNSRTVSYSGDAWDYVDLQFEGFRNADKQDEIDIALESLAFTQSDFGEDAATTKFALPEKDEKVIPNPAYIHHRPWTGVAVIDGGSFDQPSIYAGWVVDGGDFTGMQTAMLPPESTPAVPSSQYFRNAIVRVWHGKYEDMPEVKMPSTSAVWNNYAFTFRLCLGSDDGTKDGIWYTDDKHHLSQIKITNLVQYYSDPYARSEFFHQYSGGGYIFETANTKVTTRAYTGNTDPLYDLWYEISVENSNKLVALSFNKTWAYLTYDTSPTFKDENKIVVQKDLADITLPVPSTIDRTVRSMLPAGSSKIIWVGSPSIFFPPLDTATPNGAYIPTINKTTANADPRDVSYVPYKLVETVIDFSDVAYGTLKVLFDVDNNLVHFHSDYLLDSSVVFQDPFPWTNILPRDPGRTHIPNSGTVEGIIYAETQNFGRVPIIARLTFASDTSGGVVALKTGTLANDVFNGCRLKGDFTVYLKSNY
jgi:hypothetical protein